MREAGWCGMDSGETRGTKSWLRVRHWRDYRSGAATRETCLLMCVCVSVHEASGKQGYPGASYWDSLCPREICSECICVCMGICQRGYQQVEEDGGPQALVCAGASS